MLDKYSGRCKAVDDFSMKISVPSETRDIDLKLSNLITETNKAKIIIKHISWDCKCKVDSATCKSKSKME